LLGGSRRLRAAPDTPNPKGPQNKMTDLGVVGWFLGGQGSTRTGQIFGEIFFRVFELPSPKNAQKRDKQKNNKKFGLGFFVDSAVKTLRHDFFCKPFFVVFLNSHR
jgi:hypothetical protein